MYQLCTHVHTGRTFNPLLEAPPLPPPYPRNKKIQLHMQVRGCKFAKFQEVKLQELPDEVCVYVCVYVCVCGGCMVCA